MTEEKRRPRSPLVDRARELRRQQTLAQAKLWACLRNRQVAGLKFRRQHPIGPYVVDFYCVASRLAGRLPAGCGDRRGFTREPTDVRSRTDGMAKRAKV